MSPHSSLPTCLLTHHYLSHDSHPLDHMRLEVHVDEMPEVHVDEAPEVVVDEAHEVVVDEVPD